MSSGDLPLQITWSLQGHRVQGGSKTGISTAPMGPRASFLSIQSVSNQHSGVYTCTARNSAGFSSYSTNLIVNGKSQKGRSYWRNGVTLFSIIDKSRYIVFFRKNVVFTSRGFEYFLLYEFSQFNLFNNEKPEFCNLQKCF